MRHAPEFCLGGSLKSTGAERTLLLDVSSNVVHAILRDSLEKQCTIHRAALIDRRA
jgi:hypothetical protein